MPEHAQAIKAEQVRLLYEQLPSALVAHGVNILITLTVLWGEVPSSLLLAWGGMAALVVLGRYGLLRAYNQANANSAEAAHWGRLFGVGAGLAGATLGAVGLVLFPAHSLPHQAFIGFALLGMAAGGMATLSPARECYLAFLLPAVLPYALRMLAQGEGMAAAIGVISLLFVALMWRVSERLYDSIIKLLGAGYQNIALINDLEYANHGLKLANEALTGQVLEKRHVEEALRASEKTYRTLVETTNTGYLMLDLTGTVIDANEEYLRLTGYQAPDEILGRSVVEWTAPHDIERNAEEIEKCIRLGQLRNLEIDYMDFSGKITPVEINANLVKTELGLHILCLCRDITQRRRAEHRQRLLNALLSLPIEGYSLNQMSERALDLILESVLSDEPGSGAIFLAEFDKPFPMLAAARDLPPTLIASCLEAIGQSLEGGGAGEAWCERCVCQEGAGSVLGYYRFHLLAGGEILGVLMMRMPCAQILDPQELDFMRSICQTFAGIIDRKRAEARIERLAYYDTLTGLPNRRLLEDRLKQAIAQATRHREQLAVIFLDLDRFKAVNDALGHTCGDLLLKEAGRRLARCVRGSDTVARLGGDESLVVLSDTQSNAMQASAKVANQIAYVLSQPFLIDGHNLFITTSLGIALHPSDGDNPTDLIKNADTAMYHAKEQGRNNFQFFADHMNASILARLRLEQELREGLESGQFELHYQPQVDITSGRIVGAEALIRWHHPLRGMVSPGEFIPVAEETGLVVPLGEWVLWTACLQMAQWTLAGPSFRGFKHISVNVSPRQFKQANFVQTVEKVLRESGLDPKCLELEVTEASLMQNTESTLAMLDHLKKLGVRLVIDDFGIGYSCLAYLKRFPLNGLKIDASFVRDLATDPNDAALTEAIIAMGHRLDLKVIAEGVETEPQLNFLRAQGCDEFQGYLESPALPADKFEKLVALRNAPTD
jgi:diguanylate cyclase (GGDEF)-like protein/PAS domain S-box-containing protein